MSERTPTGRFKRSFYIGLVAAVIVAVVFLVVRHRPSSFDDVAGRSDSRPTTTSTTLPVQSAADMTRDGVSVTEYYPTRWIATLGGNGTPTRQTWEAFSDPSGSDLGVVDAKAAVVVARALVTAEVTGAGRDAFPDRFNGAPTLRPCPDFEVYGAAADKLPTPDGDNYVLALVLWGGSCPGGGDVGTPATTRIYLQKVNGAWRPVESRSIS